MLMVALVVFDIAFAVKDEENQLVLADVQEDEEESMVIDDETSVPSPLDPNKIFIPTNEWQTVQADQVLLPGLHVRLNLKMGLKEAKLLDGEDGTKYLEAVERIRKTGHTGFTQTIIASQPPDSQGKKEAKQEEQVTAKMRNEILEALKNIKSEDGKTPEELSKEDESVNKKFRSFEELKKDFDELDLNMETDMDTLGRLIKQYREADSDSSRITILEDLEYLVHQFDNAITFIDLGGLEVIVNPGLNSTNVAVKEGILHLLGSAVQSNPKVQIAALEAGLLHSLIQAVSQDINDSVARRAIFALSCLVRGFPYGQQVLLQHGGLEILRKVFDRNDWQSLTTQLKIVSLLHDLLVERAQAEGERQQQLSQSKLDEYVVTDGWCPAVSSLLAAASFDRRDRRYDMSAALRSEMPLRPDHDTVDKVIAAMGSMVKVCRYQFHETLPLLRSLANTYEDLAYKEQFQNDDDGGYALFKSLAEMISRLVQDIREKNEL